MARPHRSSLNPQPDQPPPRATTAPVKKHHHHIPHHPHRVHVHRRDEQRVPQSAVEPRARLNAFGESTGGSGSNGGSGRKGMQSISRDASRRESGVERESKKTVTWAEVERARSKKKRMDEYVKRPLNRLLEAPAYSSPLLRASIYTIIKELQRFKPANPPPPSDLRSTLSSLSTLSTTSTRRLDYAYYSLLERISAIISTVDSFLDLSQHTSTLCRDFGTSISSLDSDYSTQITSFDDTFATQRHRIECLQTRLRDRTQTVQVLGTRLQVARAKVESWGVREREWQARTSRRLMMLGCVLGAVGWAFVVLLGLRHWRSGGDRFREFGERGLESDGGVGGAVGYSTRD